MQIEAVNLHSGSSDPVELRIHHGDQEVLFNVSYYGRKEFSGEFDLFEQLNGYWKALSKELQDQIFECYKMLRFALDAFMSNESRIEELNRWSIKLLGLHDFDHFKTWLFFNTNIAIPPVFAETFIYDVDRHNTPEQTYLKGEYVDLVTMTLIFRTMMPIWGGYINMMRQEVGTRFKEYQAFRLVYNARIKESPAFAKMVTYIDRIIAQDRFNQHAIIEGISSEDFPTWVLSKAVVRRLCLSDIRGHDPRANLVTFLHKYVSQTTRPTDVNLTEQVKNKGYADTGEGESQHSALDRYRPKHTISIGELAENEFVLEDLRSIAYRLTSNMSDELLNRCLSSSIHLTNRRLLNPQMTLLRWVFKPVISPRGLMYISHDKIVRCLGVLQAVLWARGHKYLSVLASSYANVSEDAMLVSGMDSKARVPQPIIEELNQVYPYQKTYGGKNTGYKTQNLTVKSIDTMVDELSMSTWIPTADQEMLMEVFGTPHRRVPIQYEIKITLAQFVLELGKRSWV